LKHLVEFLSLSEKLKCQHRDNFLSNNNPESAAEHTWHMALMAMLLQKHVKLKLNTEKVFKMIIVHDLPEALTGDVPLAQELKDSSIQSMKYQQELKAMEKIREMLGEKDGKELFDLWIEYEEQKTIESKFVRSLDRLEARIQSYHYDTKKWDPKYYTFAFEKLVKYCDYDDALKEFCNEVLKKTEERLIEDGVDVEKIKKQI
jgi:putative hydrolase of HD superfamily